jgi:hypothetical protein
VGRRAAAMQILAMSSGCRLPGTPFFLIPSN